MSGRSSRSVSILSPMLLCASAGGALAQCGAWDNRFGTPTNIAGNVYCVTTFDPDGEGPDQSQIVIGGTFVTIGGVTVNGIAAWDGTVWQPLGAGLATPVNALTTWDPDGAGPNPAKLVAGGGFGIATWNGVSWNLVSPQLGGGWVEALLSWDPDQDGPQTPKLVAGGRFSSGGSEMLNGIGLWNGSVWQGFDRGFADASSTGVYALTTWDADGDGPLAPQLIAGGQFERSVAGAIVHRVARWDGATWQPLGSRPGANFDDHVFAVASFDPDATGPANPLLVIGGNIESINGSVHQSFAAWNGTAWQLLGDPWDSFAEGASDLLVWDADGAGPDIPQLFATGRFWANDGELQRIARFDGQAWHPLDGGLGGEGRALTVWDPDGAGSQPGALIVGGDFARAGDVQSARVAGYDGSNWQAIGIGLNQSVRALTTWSPEIGAPSQIVAGGVFTIAGGNAVNRIATWVDETWLNLGTGFDAEVLTIASCDMHDGSGSQLYAGGMFALAGDTPMHGIARWDGGQWNALGTGLGGSAAWAYALTAWDPDDAGPLAPLLIVGGPFIQVNGTNIRWIASWNGAAWQPLGAGLNATVNALTTWDPDGDGPLSSLLIAGGGFSLSGTQSLERVGAWNGVSWQSFGQGLGGPSMPAANSLVVWDPDGAGAQPPHLIAGGRFNSAGGEGASNIAGWNGQTWYALGSGMNGSVNALASWSTEPDGAAQLVAAGPFSSAGGIPVQTIARWDGTAWHTIAAETPVGVLSLTTWKPDSAHPDQLVVGGSFTQVAGLRTSYIALWNTMEPAILDQPDSSTACVDHDAHFSIEAAEVGAVAFQWQIEQPPGSGVWIDLADGPLLLDGVQAATVAGAQQAQLAVDCELEFRREVRCVVTNSCGEVTSETATLTACLLIADLDCDASVGLSDLAVLLSNFSTPSDASRADGDLDSDGDVDLADLALLLSSFGAGC